MEFIVLPDTLSLVVEILYRLIVVYPDISNGLAVILYGLFVKGLIGRERLDFNLVYIIGVLSVLNIILQILAFLVDLIWSNHQRLDDHGSNHSSNSYGNNGHRCPEEFLILLLVHVNNEEHCTNYRRCHYQPVYPEGHIYICKTCSVNSSCMCMKEVKLIEEKVHCHHYV